MEPQLKIRQAIPDDAPAITRLHASGWREGYGAFFDPEVLEEAIEQRHSRWTGLLQKEDLGGTILFVGEQDATIVAFAHAGPAHDHPGGFEIYSFYVDPAHWGTRVADELMVHVLGFARSRGYQRRYLYTYSQSARARRFYEKLGFTETGRTTRTHLPHDVVTIDIEYLHEEPRSESAANVAVRRDADI